MVEMMVAVVTIVVEMMAVMATVVVVMGVVIAMMVVMMMDGSGNRVGNDDGDDGW
jgi:hypothetical protein